MTNSSAKNDKEFAKRAMRSLNSSQQANEKLDLQIANYIRAELSGDDVATLFPDVHRYVRESDHAWQLYSDLMGWIRDQETGEDIAPTQKVVVDVSVIRSVQSFRMRVTALATSAIQQLRANAGLEIDLFVDAFFDLRPGLDPNARIQDSSDLVFGALGGDVDEEIRWLEAAFQYVRHAQSLPNASRQDIAIDAAKQAGLPKSLQRAFAKICESES